jgi:primosomal protein N'
VSVGNWRLHILVDCDKCDKPMGWHIVTTKVTCNECKAKELSE